jgi:acetyl-CoA synthetase
VPDIESTLREERRFPPPAGFAAKARVGPKEVEALRAQARADPDAFWGGLAERTLVWHKKWDRVLDWAPPKARWFPGGRLNASVQCLDRHLDGPRRDKAALIWEGEPGEVRTLTYLQLAEQVGRAANALRSLGLREGDRVCIYMPLIPEAVVAMLACARIGATHSVVFGGFSAQALADRVHDCGAVVVITADAGYRKGAPVALKEQADAALRSCPEVKHCLVVKRAGVPVAMHPGRDRWWHEALEHASPRAEPAWVESTHPLFILYTSGTTGKPKGIVHGTGGYMLGAAVSTSWVFDLRDEDVYWCTADIGWVTGHTYVVYGPLSQGATVLLYEGAPTHPSPDRWWAMVARHRVSVLYTAPTAIRTFMRLGAELPAKHDLSSLRLLGTVGEPINPEAWMWYRAHIGRNLSPIVDTWWQTETGSILVSPLPGATTTKPGSATQPLPGVEASVVAKDGQPCAPDEGGFLVITRPWPSMLQGIWGDDARYAQQYWSQVPGAYFTGDGARRDRDGDLWIMGRVDDVIKVSGHRLGTAEVESALVAHPKVAEAAVVARPDAVKGEAIVAFVTLKAGVPHGPALAAELRDHVARLVGAVARPEDVRFADALPKTRSGKIMRRLLREVAAGGQVQGDTTTLEDLTVLEKLRAADED